MTVEELYKKIDNRPPQCPLLMLDLTADTIFEGKPGQSDPVV